ncbi:DNA repair protein complementing XP-C cells homolog [Eumeta japonica]|uniref:DNA repair protein complementing XP-C cells homolog n=1 Tax=Eumeta variegata TaxID=151549 RepID=A0A4C1S9N5_EUMVA|nr:DNA repair protein complementing XP-C cells homolog [Eumeta japonica]
MPTTRKKIIKTVYDDEEGEDEYKDFSDSGSEAVISEESLSSEEIDEVESSADEFQTQSTKPVKIKKYAKKQQFTKSFITRIQKQMIPGGDEENSTVPLISVKDLTEEDKLLPPILNLSESDSSDDDEPSTSYCQVSSTFKTTPIQDSETEKESATEYIDVWPTDLQDNSAEIAKKTFEQLEQHTNEIAKTKATLAEYKARNKNTESNVKDLLALGEEFSPSPVNKRKHKVHKKKNDSESEIEEWEEVKEVKTVPQQGIQLIVDFPDAAVKRSKKIDVEMMMKRKINRVKKEYQVYMHKVHILCWLGHGNYVSRILNDQEILAAALTLVSSNTYYPGERVDLKYIEQITSWFKNKLVLKQDKHENKFKPKAPSLKDILKTQIHNKVVTTKKYLVFVFVSMLRALGLQCRVMFNFTTLPLKPSNSELCSLSTKPQKDKKKESTKKDDMLNSKKPSHSHKKKQNNENSKSTPAKISQLDGNDDTLLEKKSLQKNNRSTCKLTKDTLSENDISPPKRARKSFKESLCNEMKDIGKKTLPLKNAVSPKKTRQSLKNNNDSLTKQKETVNNCAVTNNIPKKVKLPKIQVSKEDVDVSSKYFIDKISDSDKVSVTIQKTSDDFLRVTRTRSQTTNVSTSNNTSNKIQNLKIRTKSAPGKSAETSKYFKETDLKILNKDNTKNLNIRKRKSVQEKGGCDDEDKQRISHKDIMAKTNKKPRNDVKSDLIKIIKGRVKEAKTEAKRKLVKDEEIPRYKNDIWCEVYIEELEQWISVDVIEAKVHCCSEIYKRSTQPVAYIVGWDNNNYLKDLTRRYVPHWNTVTRKLRVEPSWWNTALKPWLGPKTAKDKEEDEHLDKLQLEAPLPKSIAEYKNHPLYALTRHLLKFEAIYPQDAPTLGFVRSEPVYARECVYVCRSRDVWLKEAKVVRLGEKPYKIVKARPKWDKQHQLPVLNAKSLPAKLRPDPHQLQTELDQAIFLPEEFVMTSQLTNPQLQENVVLSMEGTPTLSSGTSTKRHVYSNPLQWKRQPFQEKNHDYPEMPRTSVALNKISTLMTRDRFLTLRNAFTRSGIGQPYQVMTILWKVLPMIDKIKEGCRKQERGSGFYSIDEQMIPFTGRGAKMMFGDKKGSFGLGPSIILHLAKSIPPCSCVYHDQYCITIPLIEEMLNRGLHSTRTIMLNKIRDRSSLKLKDDKKMVRGDSDHMVRGLNKTMYLLDFHLEIHEVLIKAPEKRRVKDEEKEPVVMPRKYQKAVKPSVSLSNKVIKDQPLELFGPWQVQDYEPPVAENGIVPRNAYGNVELFKDCMLPVGTVHMKLPGLNKVARKLNIDCAPAMIGFDFNGGWTHPVYDGFVVCKEFEEILTDAWFKDQEEQERREQEKLDARVYGNWKRLIKGLLIRERLKEKYGFEEPTTSKEPKKKSKGPRLVVKKYN